MEPCDLLRRVAGTTTISTRRAASGAPAADTLSTMARVLATTPACSRGAGSHQAISASRASGEGRRNDGAELPMNRVGDLHLPRDACSAPFLQVSTQYQESDRQDERRCNYRHHREQSKHLRLLCFLRHRAAATVKSDEDPDGSRCTAPARPPRLGFASRSIAGVAAARGWSTSAHDGRQYDASAGYDTYISRRSIHEVPSGQPPCAPPRSPADAP